MSPEQTSQRNRSYRFRVSLSFPGEHRSRVEHVAVLLARHLGPSSVLYDQWYEAEFARPNLDVYLPELYHDDSQLVVFFLCAEYSSKEWCGLEWRAGRDLLKRRQDPRLMFVRLDHADIPGLYSIDGYLDAAAMSDERIADSILTRVASLTSVQSHQTPSVPAAENTTRAVRVTEEQTPRAATITYHGAEFVLVPAGRFLMGSTPGDFNSLGINDETAMQRETTQHVVDVPEFLMSRHPVTNAQYREYVLSTKCAVPFRDDIFSSPFNWNAEERTFPPGMDEFPVVLVSWHDAQSFARWFGGRLPTEAEWEKAARGVEGRIWPWGNVWQDYRCNTAEAALGGPTPVGHFSPRGDSPFGFSDMSGNVWEWCSSFCDPYPYKSADGRELGGLGERVIRGGSWNLDRFKSRCAYRGGTPPQDFGFTIGLRVVLERSK